MKNIYNTGGVGGCGIWTLSFVIFFALLFIFGCSTQRKIDKSINVLSKNDKLDDVCLLYFPCKVTGTSTMSETDRAAYDSAMFEMQIREWDLMVSFDSLAAVLRVDTACIKYLPALLLLAEENKKLKNQIAAIPPIIRSHKTNTEVEDPAKINVLNEALDGEVVLRVQSETREKIFKERVKELEAKIKGKILLSWWWLVLIGLAAGSFISFKIYNFIRFKTNFLKPKN